MNRFQISAFLVFVFGMGLLGAGNLPRQSVKVHPQPGPRSNTVFRGARPSYAVRVWNGKKRYIQFQTQIQHVVVVYMENRTPDDLFAGYFGQSFPGHTTWGTALDLHNPAVAPTLVPNPLNAPFDPDHSHEPGFENEAAGMYQSIIFGCPGTSIVACPASKNPYSYVSPSSETAQYASMIETYAYARHVLQSNEGPSYVSHQYAIAGQSGALSDPFLTPYAQAENPHETAPPTQNYIEDSMAPLGNCFSTPDPNPPYDFWYEKTLNMSLGYNQRERPNPSPPPCQQYPTILDEIGSSEGVPQYLDWQYIASRADGIWAAPMAINSLYNNYVNQVGGPPAKQPFAVDPDAVTFVQNLNSANPSRPFAALTYITPCIFESDHPNMSGTSDGPAWLAWLINNIGHSQYWPNTTIIVTWDDWGGWYDSYQPKSGSPPSFPYHPVPNPYPTAGFPMGNPQDANEWGFRVPLIVISPYGAQTYGNPNNTPYISDKLRSQGAILNYIEATFGLNSLGGDDSSNIVPGPPQVPDALQDMFIFQNQNGPATPQPFVPIPNPNPYIPHACPAGG